MGKCRLGLAAAAALGLLIAIRAEPAGAVGALAPTGLPTDGAALAVPAAFHHHARRSQSFYCYPRNYWWFYRPYTTANDGHARCMPYFHYLAPGEAGRGGGPAK